MNKEKDLKLRTKSFCIDCIRLAESLPNTYLGKHIQGQLIRSSSSVAANYRAAKLAQSTAAFVSKISIVIEEADESQFWLELIDNLRLINSEQRNNLEKEASELVAIFISSRKKLHQRKFN
ncbi:four helix bundle protein [Draconibacterium orientale]|uniref:four helix bundle protein n=1 Tax=Draconibacterium orientale TaxID=1168034 RepID=UPI0029BFE37A|nr:four helix bundle protein [Draconibacterium orientale]